MVKKEYRSNHKDHEDKIETIRPMGDGSVRKYSISRRTPAHNVIFCGLDMKYKHRTTRGQYVKEPSEMPSRPHQVQRGAEVSPKRVFFPLGRCVSAGKGLAVAPWPDACEKNYTPGRARMDVDILGHGVEDNRRILDQNDHE